MGNTKISDLTSGGSAVSTDLLPIDRSGTNYSLTAAAVAALATGIPTSGLIGLYTFTDGSGLSLADSSGNGNTGVLGDSAAITNISKSGSTLTVTCANDFVQNDSVRLDGMTTNTALNFSTTGVFYTVATASGSQFTVTGFAAAVTNGAETGTATSRCPTWITGGLNFVANLPSHAPDYGYTAAGGQYVRFPAGLNTAQSVVMFIGKQPYSPLSYGSNWIQLFCSDSGVSGTSTTLLMQDSSTVVTNGNSGLGGGNPCTVINLCATPAPIGNVVLGWTMGVAANSTTDQCYINGNLLRALSSLHSYNPSLAGQYRIGGCASLNPVYPSFFTGQIYYMLVYNRALSAAEHAQIAAYITNQMTNRGIHAFNNISSAGNMILSDGDSVQAYSGGWFAHNTIDPNKIGTWSQSFISVAGDGTKDMFQRSWASDALLPPSQPYAWNTTPGGLGIAEFMIGTNNLGNTPTQIQANQAICASYARVRRNAGWNKVIQSTLMDGGNSSNKNSYNFGIRSTWTDFCDALADVAAHPALGADGANSGGSNNYYFANGVHPSVVGQTIIGAIKSRVINHIIGNTLTSGTPCVAGHQVSINNTVLATNVATYTTTTNHHYQINEWVTVSGLSNNPTVFNVLGQVSAVTDTTFSFNITHAPIGSGADTGTAIANPFTMLDTDTYIQVDHSNGVVSVYLCSALGYTGQRIWIKNLYSADSNAVTLYPNATLDTLNYTVTATAMDGSNNLTVTAKHNFRVGDVVTFSGLATSTFLNGQSVTISSLIGSLEAYTGFVGTGYSHSTYGTTSEATGTATKTLPAQTIDGASSLVVANGSTVCLLSNLVSPETGLNNWISVV